MNPTNNKTPDVSLLEHTVAGATAGVTDVLITHPLVVIKNRIQCQYNFTLYPSIIYKGVLGNAFSMIPLVTTQVLGTAIIQREIQGKYPISPTSERFIASFIAGGISSSISTPVELTLVQQQKHQLNFLPTGINFYNERGFLKFFIGIPATAIRTGIISSGFISLMPYFKAKAKERQVDDKVAVFASGTAAGLIASLLSQPFDTIKTDQQKYADEKSKSFRQSTTDIFSQGRYRGLFSGGFTRASRVMVTTTILGEVTKGIEDYFALRKKP